MKTRIELWKEYRDEINNNIELQQSVQFSNEKLKVLYDRLLKVFPEYEEKYKVELAKISISSSEISKAPQFSLEKINELLRDVEALYESDNNFGAIEKIDFSSHELDDVIKDVQDRRAKESKYYNLEESTEITINRHQMVKLSRTQEVKTMRKVSIAIDGPSGSGKSTVAKTLAKRYGLTYINTGLVYRAIALNAIEEGANLNDASDVVKTLRDGMIILLEDEQVLLNGENVSKALRRDEVSQGASKVAAIPQVREWAVALQKMYGQKDGIIMDGRDTTFKIMPNADVKIFLETAPEIRAQRRVDQNHDLGFNVNYDEILEEIKERDFRDRNREVDPLHKTDDAHLVDASHMTIDEVVGTISKYVDEKLS